MRQITWNSKKHTRAPVGHAVEICSPLKPRKELAKLVSNTYVLRMGNSGLDRWTKLIAVATAAIAAATCILILVTSDSERSADSIWKPRTENGQSDSGRQSYPVRRYAITIPSEYQIESITPSHTRWAESLVRNLDHDGGIHIFMLTDLPLELDDSTLKSCVYGRLDTIPQFLIHLPTKVGSVIIDRQSAEIGTVSGAGNLHPHPDGKMVVCLGPKEARWILGIVLGDPKTQVPAPVFRDSSVNWVWD